MDKNRSLRWCAIGLVVILGHVLVDVPLFAQTQAPVPAPKAGEAVADPIRCWWKADRAAVRVGERFGLVLTCTVIETGPITVVPVLNQLEPGAVLLTPFEVVSGSRHEDVVADPRRYVQFEYSVRMLGDGFFGQDVNIPALTVTYNLKERSGGTQGRDQTYVMPPLPMRILSLVPKGADDIRDASGQTFATIESRRSRSRAATVTAWISYAFAAVFVLLALVRFAGLLGVRTKGVVRAVPAPSLLRACLGTLAQVKKDAAQAGWSSELSRRAAAALRIAGAVALGRRVTQNVVGADAQTRDGQVVMDGGWPRRRRVLLSAATTSRTIATGLGNGHGPGAQARVSLESLSEALGVFSTAGYGRSAQEDFSALDAALEHGTKAVRGIRGGTLWPSRTAQALRSFVGL